jgi:hypothetical protein
MRDGKPVHLNFLFGFQVRRYVGISPPALQAWYLDFPKIVEPHCPTVSHDVVEYSSGGRNAA